MWQVEVFGDGVGPLARLHLAEVVPLEVLCDAPSCSEALAASVASETRESRFNTSRSFPGKRKTVSRFSLVRFFASVHRHVIPKLLTRLTPFATLRTFERQLTCEEKKKLSISMPQLQIVTNNNCLYRCVSSCGL